MTFQNFVGHIPCLSMLLRGSHANQSRKADAGSSCANRDEFQWRARLSFVVSVSSTLSSKFIQSKFFVKLSTKMANSKHLISDDYMQLLGEKMKPQSLLLLGFLLAGVSLAEAGYPLDVADYIERREVCEHFRQEPWPEGSSVEEKGRREFIAGQFERYCKGTDRTI